MLPWPRRSRRFTALIIPADPEQPCHVEPIARGDDGLERVRELVSGFWVDQASYDSDAHLYLNGLGSAVGLPGNPRATRLTRRRTRGMPDGEAGELTGDVVLAGTRNPLPRGVMPPGTREELLTDETFARDACDVPERFYDLFGVPPGRSPASDPAGSGC